MASTLTSLKAIIKNGAYIHKSIHLAPTTPLIKHPLFHKQSWPFNKMTCNLICQAMHTPLNQICLEGPPTMSGNQNVWRVIELHDTYIIRGYIYTSRSYLFTTKICCWNSFNINGVISANQDQGLVRIWQCIPNSCLNTTKIGSRMLLKHVMTKWKCFKRYFYANECLIDAASATSYRRRWFIIITTINIMDSAKNVRHKYDIRIVQCISIL